MPQQSSQHAEQQIHQHRVDESWVVEDVQDDPYLNESPSTLQIQRPSNPYVKNKSHASINSKQDLIRVSKCKHPSIKLESSQEVHINSNAAILKKQCRICLEDQSDGRLVKPCKCTGSMQYAHQHCLCEWIKRKINFKTRVKAHCQVCEQPFEYKISKSLSISYQVLLQNYHNNRSNYLCFLAVMLIMIPVWLVLTVLTVMGFSDSSDNWVRKYVMLAQSTKVVFICVILVYMLIMGFVSLLFVAQYGIRTELIVKNVQNYSKKYKKIAPKLHFIAT